MMRLVYLSLMVSGGLLNAQLLFTTPEEAKEALQKAVESRASLKTLMGGDATEVLETGDANLDGKYRSEFLEAIKVKSVFVTDAINPRRMVLEVGAEEWPLPFPLILAKSGKWYWSLSDGKKEWRHRIIGGNELDAIDSCAGYVLAQKLYAEVDRDGDGTLEFAQKATSDEGKKDGLYWKGAGSPILESFAQSMLKEGYRKESGQPDAYHGYYFKMLTGQGPAAEEGARSYIVQGDMIGGFGLVAWPMKYGVSGVKTFIVNQDGVTYEKDLGATTAQIAQQMSLFNPDKSWQPAPEY